MYRCFSSRKLFKEVNITPFFNFFSAPFVKLKTTGISSSTLNIKFLLISNSFKKNAEFQKICITKIASACPGDKSLYCREIVKSANETEFVQLNSYCNYTFVGHFKTEVDSQWILLTTPALDVKTDSAGIFLIHIL